MKLINKEDYKIYEHVMNSVIHTKELNESEVEKYDEMKARVAKAVISVTSKYPFFASFIYKLKIVFTDEVKTMATDGFRIFVSYKWTSTLNLSEVVFVLCHEILHNVFLHFYRRVAYKIPTNKYHLNIWNMAADYEINPILINDGVLSKSEFDKLGGLYEEKYLDMPAETIYDLLIKENEDSDKNDNGDESDSDGSGKSKKTGNPSNYPGPGEKGGPLDENLTPEEGDKLDPDGKDGRRGDDKDDKTPGDSLEDIRRQWLEDRQKNAGKATGSLRSKLSGLHAPEMNWKKELKKFVGNNMSSKRDVMPARRHVAGGRYLTGMVRETKDLDFIVAFVDTSGSMTSEDIEQCLSEFRGIVEDKKPKEAAIVYFDAGIQKVDWLKSNRKEPNLDLVQGGGGTAFRPCLKFLEQNFLKKGRRVDLVIFMTDGFNSDNGPMGTIDIPKPTYANKWVWVITDGAGSGAAAKTRWGMRVNLPKSK